jgi:hypothetical protein
MASYTLTIDGTDRTRAVENRTVEIFDSSGSSASTLTFTMNNRDGGAMPECDDEVVLIQDGERLFGGRILRINPSKIGDFVMYKVDCIDYVRDLDRNLVREGYQDMTDKEIIKDIVDNYCGGTGITYDNVTEGISISNMTFNYVPPSECFSIICKLTGREWYIDYNKDVHYGLKFLEYAPFNISN